MPSLSPSSRSSPHALRWYCASSQVAMSRQNLFSPQIKGTERCSRLLPVLRPRRQSEGFITSERPHQPVCMRLASNSQLRKSRALAAYLSYHQAAPKYTVAVYIHAAQCKFSDLPAVTVGIDNFCEKLLSVDKFRKHNGCFFPIRLIHLRSIDAPKAYSITFRVTTVSPSVTLAMEIGGSVETSDA